MKLIDLLQSQNQDLIEKTLQERFATNLALFATHHLKLYEKLLLPPQNYNLLIDQNGINLINLKNKTFVYPKENHRHMMIDTHLDLARSPLQNPKWKLKHNDLYLQKMDENQFPITAQAVNAFIQSLDDLGGVASFHLPEFFLPSTCVFGALGGLFVQFLLDQGFFFHSFLWFEEEIDFLRIACFFVDFTLLFERCSSSSCYLFVQDLMHKEIIRTFFTTQKITNNFLRLELSLYTSAKISSAKGIIQELQAQNSRGWGSFEDECIGLQHTLKNLKSKPSIFSTFKRLDIPICVVGNGSSLDSLLPFIKDNQDKMIVLSCGTALKVLKNYGISPDFQIEIERIDYLHHVLEDAPLGDTPLIGGNMLNPLAFSLAKEKYLFMRGGSSGAYFASTILELSSPFVGNAGVALACALGSDVILCGLDCGYIEGQKKHAQGSFYGEEDEAIPSDAFLIKGNKHKKVYATSLYALSASMMGMAIAHFKPNFVLNLGEGAYIQGSKSIDAQDFTLKSKNKKDAIQAFKSCFVSTEYPIDKINFFNQVSQYTDALKKYLSIPITTKPELFNLIDTLTGFCSAQSRSNPSIGILFEGSISHLLQNLMMCALHYPHNDITPLYVKCLESWLIALDKFKLKLRVLFALADQEE